jgi:hypothetical protein
MQICAEVLPLIPPSSPDLDRAIQYTAAYQFNC